jgi:hypothetical protein
MQTWTFDEVRPPPGGPWDTEPDKAQWVDEATGLDCLVLRHARYGNLCGYVGLPPGHPLHERGPFGLDLEVHGGVNYAAYCQEGAEDGYGICHVPGPGRPEHVWWLGFDCGHGWDFQPSMEAHLKSLGIDLQPLREAPYRTFEYVTGEVTGLAQQLKAVEIQ